MTNSNTKSVKILELANDNLDELISPVNVLVSNQLNSVDVLRICTLNDVHHVVQKSNLKHDKEIQLSASMILKPSQFMAYPLSSILGVDNPDAQTEKDATNLYFEFTAPEQKGEIVDLVGDIVKQSGTGKNPRSLSDDIKCVADELITNSIYNAPYVDKENSTSGIDRDPTLAKIDPSKKPCFFMGGDADRIIIGSRDYYGRLNVKKIIERIRRCYEENPAKLINFNEGGAGIGAFFIFDSCTSMYITVDEGKSTTICCAFPLGLSAQQRYRIPKNLHLWF